MGIRVRKPQFLAGIAASSFSVTFLLGLSVSGVSCAAIAQATSAPSVPTSSRSTDSNAASPAAVHEQKGSDNATSPAGSATVKPKEMDTIVITATNAARTEFNTPISVTVIDSAKLDTLTASGQADILTTIKGIKAEGGGGEVAANVQVRVLPSMGQYQFTPLEYDGVPVFSTFGLNSSAFDVYARNDLGIDRLEYVSGGVSNLFGPGSVAGIISYISKTGGQKQEGIVQTEFADHGRARIDFATSGPIDADNVYAVSGFYRYDQGPLDTGLATKGFQLRGNYRHYFRDGSGSFTVYGQAIDDKDQFFVPIPLDPTDKKRIKGDDGHTLYSLDTDAINGMRVPLPGGTEYTFDHVDDGVSTKGGALYTVLEKNLAEDWSLNGKLKYSKYAHRFGLFDATDGLTNVPETLSGFIKARNLGAVGTPEFTYADSGQPLQGNDLIMQSRFTDRYRPATDYTGELSVLHSFDWGDTKHDLTIGGYYASAKARDYDRTLRYLTNVKNSPDLVDLTFVDPAGNIAGTYSAGGLTGLVSYINNRASADRAALYIADQIQADRWAFDVGYRVEHISGDVTREISANQKISAADLTALTGAVNPLSNLATVTTGSGAFQAGSVSSTSWDLSADALYRLTDEVNLYANVSRGFFFPQLNSVTFSATGDVQSYAPEIIRMGELGAKFRFGDFSGSVAGFYQDLKNRRNVGFINGPNGSLVEAVNVLSTKGYGVEFDGRYRLTEALSVGGNLTLQNHYYTKYDVTPTFVGNELLRKPKVLANLGIDYDDGIWDATIFDNYQGLNYANDSQLPGVKIAPYHLWRLQAGYRFLLDDEHSLHAGFEVFNLFNSQGLAEGNPRAFNSQTGAEAYFVGRPILPRRYTLHLTYKW